MGTGTAKKLRPDTAVRAHDFTGVAITANQDVTCYHVPVANAHRQRARGTVGKTPEPASPFDQGAT